MQMNIPVDQASKKKRILKLRNELEKNPVQSNNPSYLLKIYYDIKDMKKLSEDNLERLTKIMEEEQLKTCGDLIANQLKDKTDQEKLMALLNLLQLRDLERLKNCTYNVYMRIEEEDKDGQTVVNEYKFKINKGKNLNEEVLRLEKENASKINEIKSLLEQKLKNRKDQDPDSSIIENLKKELDKELKQQNDLKVDIQKSGIDDPDEQQKLLDKLAQQKRNLEEQKNARIRAESERLRKQTEEKYRKQLDSLEEEEKQKELKEIEELEKRKNEILQKRRQEHLERKKKLQEGRSLVSGSIVFIFFFF